MQNWRIHETLIKCCSVNLAFALGMLRNASSTTPRLRVGILDLDVFGPSIPTLMGLQNSMEPELTTCVFVLSYSAHRYMLCFFYNIHHLSINTFFFNTFCSRCHQTSDESRGSVHVNGLPTSPNNRSPGYSNSMAWINGAKSCSTTPF